MIKRILIPLDNSPYTESVLNYGCFLAKIHGSELTGLAVIDIPGIEKSVGPVPAGASHYAEELRETRKQEAVEHVESLLKQFRERCEKEGVPFRESLVQGGPSENIIIKSMFFDLVIVGQKTSYKFGTEEEYGDSLDNILDNSITPILAVPEKFLIGEKVKALFAFNGSLPAARAMQRFVNMVYPKADRYEITILISEEEMDTANFYLDNAERYFNMHGFSKINKIWTPESINEAFDKKHYDESDLIIVGMHSKNILKDFFVGKLIKYLIRKGEKPIFIGQ